MAFSPVVCENIVGAGEAAFARVDLFTQGNPKGGVMKVLVGLCIIAALLLCSCATEGGRDTQNGVTIEAIGGSVSGQAGVGHAGASR